jgi:hypothetical protein
MFNRQWKESDQSTITIEIPDENIDRAGITHTVILSDNVKQMLYFCYYNSNMEIQK